MDNKKIITGEPTAEELNAIFDENLTLPIRIAGKTGTITHRNGGFGEIAIEVNFPGIPTIFARERESNEYAQLEENQENEILGLEVYSWEREDDEKYIDSVFYYSLSDAIKNQSWHNTSY